MNHSDFVSKIIATSAAFALSFSAVPAAAFATTPVGDSFTADGIAYVVTSETECSVAQQTTLPSGAVTIPSTAGGYSVTAIANNAFGNEELGMDITSISIPSTVQTIGANAFRNCSKLTTVSIAENAALSSIGDYAFYQCSALESVSIPISVTKIGSYSFSNCGSLTAVSFESPQAEGPRLTCGEGTFSLSSSINGHLESIELPARISNVPTFMFLSRRGLKSVTFAGESIGYIGVKAFYCCYDIETIEIPELTASGIKVFENAFRGLNSLNTLIFKGNESYGLSKGGFGYASNVVDTANGNPITYYSGIETIIYYGTHTSDLSYNNPTIYQAVYYYANREDAEAKSNPTATVLVQNDVALKDIAASANKTLRGTVPELAAGQSWAYLSGTPVSLANTRFDAYPVSSSDLAYGAISLSKESIAYTGTAAHFDCSVVDANGNPLVEGSDYSISITNSQGQSVSKDQVINRGTYTVTATAMGAYSGSVSTEFSIVEHHCTWTRTSGTLKYSSPNHMLDFAFSKDDTKTVIVVGPKALAAGAASGGLAGVRDAAIITTETDKLDLETIRTLRVFSPESVFLVGIEDATTATDDILTALSETVSVSNAFAANTQEEMSYLLYSRTKSKGYWKDSETAYVASSSDLAGATIAGSMAYNTKCPVFLVDNSGALSADACNAVAGFDSITMVGELAKSGSALASQLSKAGFSGTTKKISAANNFELSAAVATSQIESSAISVDNPVLLNPKDEAKCVVAISACGKMGSPLLFVDETAAGRTAVDSVVKANQYDISQGFIFATMESISSALQHELEQMNCTDDPFDLSCATLSLSESSYVYDGNVHLPTLTLTSIDGVEIPRTEKNEAGSTLTNYTVNLVFDSTDKRSASGVRDAGSWTFIVSGRDRYSNSAFATLTVTPADGSKASLKLSATKATYSGKALKPKVTPSLADLNLVEGTDYTVAYRNNINVGTGSAVVTFKGNFSGSCQTNFSITKAANSMSAKATKKSLKRSTKKTQSLAIKTSGAQGKVTFKVKSYPKKGKKYVTINSKGKITIKKKAPKGTYKFTVNAAGNSNYLSKSLTLSLKVK